MNWLGEKNQSRNWPEHAKLESIIKGFFGYSIRLTKVHTLGGRSLLIEMQKKTELCKMVLLRQRNSHSRVCLPLAEEASLLSFLSKKASGLAPKPLYFYRNESDVTDHLLFVEWKAGTTVGATMLPSKKSVEVSELLEKALSRLHEACLGVKYPKLSRTISLNKIFSKTGIWNSAELQIFTKCWQQKIECLGHLVSQFESNTIIHGDPHVYNLLSSNDGISWIDFECAALGPPEFDLTRKTLLLILQSGILPDISRQKTQKQLACDVIVGSEWIFYAPKNILKNEIELVKRFVLESIKLINRS
jgi:aminoglycoside phosphotransferase (APT) family kinase protein